MIVPYVNMEVRHFLIVLCAIVQRCLSLEWVRRGSAQVWVLAKKLATLQTLFEQGYVREALRVYLLRLKNPFLGIHEAVKRLYPQAVVQATLRVDRGLHADKLLWVSNDEEAAQRGELFAERLIRLAENIITTTEDDPQRVYTALVGSGLLAGNAPYIDSLLRIAHQAVCEQAYPALFCHAEERIQRSRAERVVLGGITRRTASGALEHLFS